MTDEICENCGKKKKLNFAGKYVCHNCKKDRKCHICGRFCNGYYCKDHRGFSKGGSLSPSKIRQRKRMKIKYEKKKNMS